MSAATASAKGLALRTAQVAGLLLVFALMIVAIRLAPQPYGTPTTIAAVGFLLLGGLLTSALCEIVGLPHLTGYLLAGVLAGPHVLQLIEHDTVEQLSLVNTLALALIALAGGAELHAGTLKRLLRSLAWNNWTQAGLVLLATGAVFYTFSGPLVFGDALGWRGLLAASALWGVLAISRSPSATLAILSQTRAREPLTTFSLAFVMSSDVIVILTLTLTMVFARPLMDPSASLSFEELGALGHEIVGSVALGTTIGLILAAYLRLIGSQLLLVLIALGFGVTEGLRYLHFDPLLTFLVAGFVVQNLSNQGEKLLHAIEETGSVVFVVFFATAGAHLDLPLLRAMWPAALALAAVRAVTTIIAHRVGSRLARDEPVVQRWGWASLVSQAGLTLGLSVVIERSFPALGTAFRSLVIATVALNEVIGPVLFKLALDRSRETQARPSLLPGPP
ncbi:MAG TPA: cation:proton antiporter [Polyangiaceae bacterium]|nr:cation:proton antiporter [Polyangiaceae bacterium]